MPGQVSGDHKSPKPKSIERPRNVQFAAYVEDYVSSPEMGKARPQPSNTAGKNVDGSRSTNANGATNASISNTHSNATPKTASAADYEPTKDTQPSSFPSVGPPPSNINNYGGRQWHTSVDPSQSLNWPGGQLHAGPPWASSYNGASPGPHFHAPWAPPHHLVNNAAYPVFAPPSPYPYVGLPLHLHESIFSFLSSFLFTQTFLSLLFFFILFIPFFPTATISPLWATTRTACRLPRGSTFNHRFLIPLSAPCRMSTSLVLMGDTLLALKLVNPQCTCPRSSSINLVLALISFQRRFTSTDTLTMQVQPELSKSFFGS